MKFFRPAYKILCYTLAAVCMACLLLMMMSYLTDGKIVQYRVPDSSTMATELYYTIVEYLDMALLILLIVWFPFSFIMLAVSSGQRMSLFARIGIAAFVCGYVILRADPFGIWFYIWD